MQGIAGRGGAGEHRREAGGRRGGGAPRSMVERLRAAPAGHGSHARGARSGGRRWSGGRVGPRARARRGAMAAHAGEAEAAHAMAEQRGLPQRQPRRARQGRAARRRHSPT